jgi:dsDNA-specific endonuclease/ATPase MutS2
MMVSPSAIAVKSNSAAVPTLETENLKLNMAAEEQDPFPEPVELPITWELDLHNFRPNEIKDLVPDYLSECRERGILEVRIIHGKGIGNLRRTVHAILSRMPEVVSFRLADETVGGWGATMVQLRPKNP